jgi:hypothetical protein
MRSAELFEERRERDLQSVKAVDGQGIQSQELRSQDKTAVASSEKQRETFTTKGDEWEVRGVIGE